jgi:hypothetical protein
LRMMHGGERVKAFVRHGNDADIRSMVQNA